MYKGEGFLRSSRSWFIFFVNDSVSGSVKEVAFGRLHHRNTSLLKSPWQCGCARPGDMGSIGYLFSLVFVSRDGRKIDPLEHIYQETFAPQKSWLCFGLQGHRFCQVRKLNPKSLFGLSLISFRTALLAITKLSSDRNFALSMK